MDTLGFVLLLVFLAVGFIILWFVRGKDFFRERRAAGWPLVSARVEDFEVTQLRRGFFTTTLYYSYSAQGHFYSGKFAGPTMPSQETADSAGLDWQLSNHGPLQSG